MSDRTKYQSKYARTLKGRATQLKATARRDRSEQGRWATLEANEAYRLAHPEVFRAKSMLRYMIKVGKIEKPECCERCGRCIGDPGVTRIEAHHYLGYEKEHYCDVLWLCHLCHEIVDGRNPDCVFDPLLGGEDYEVYARFKENERLSDVN